MSGVCLSCHWSHICSEPYLSTYPKKIMYGKCILHSEIVKSLRNEGLKDMAQIWRVSHELNVWNLLEHHGILRTQWIMRAFLYTEIIYNWWIFWCLVMGWWERESWVTFHWRSVISKISLCYLLWVLSIISWATLLQLPWRYETSKMQSNFIFPPSNNSSS